MKANDNIEDSEKEWGANAEGKADRGPEHVGRVFIGAAPFKLDQLGVGLEGVWVEGQLYELVC